ncbi:MAG: LptF/LptG family permease [Pseudomonadales bacterium]
MKVLDRHISWLAIKPALIGLFGLMGIFSVFTLSLSLREVLIGESVLDQLLYRVLLRNVVVSDILVPTTFFFGIVMALSSWHRDREAFAFYASGASPWRVERSLYLLAALVAMITLLITTTARPWGYRTLEALDNQSQGQLLNTINPGTFNEAQGVVIAAKTVNQQTREMQDVFVYRNLENAAEVIRSETAEIGVQQDNGQVPVEFYNGESFNLNSANQLVRHAHFEKLIYLLEYQIPTRPPRRQTKTMAQLSTATLPKEQAEYQWRLTLPAIAFMLAVYGIALGRTRPSASPYPRLAAAMGIYVLVFNISSAARSAIENQQLESVPVLPLVPGLMAGGYLLLHLWRGNRADRPE